MTDESDDRGRARRLQEDEVIMTALVVGRTYAEAGEVASRSERTVRRRMADPVFAAEVSRRRGERAAALTGQLVGAGPGAVDVLRGCLEADSEAVRLRAAQLILGLGSQFRHAQELEARLVALEAAAGAAAGVRSDD